MSHARRSTPRAPRSRRERPRPSAGWRGGSKPAAWTATCLLAALLGCQAAGPEPTDATSEDGALPIDALLDIGSALSNETPVWSPDGSAILVASGGELAAIDPESGARTTLGAELGSPGVFLASQQPRYSPDGAWVSWIAGADYVQEIRLWSEAEGEGRRLTNLGARINSYSWSPDGRWIALAGDRYGAYDIWKVEVATGDVHRLTSDRRNEVFPSWTPDGERILYVRLDDRWVDHDLVEMRADGAETRLVYADRDMFDYQDGGKFGYPMASPDGSLVLFRSDRSGWLNYWVVPRAGGEPRAIASEAADQSDARWSPDGRWIAYTANRNGTRSLHVVAAEGGEPRTLVAPEGMGVVARPAWSPDGTRLSYTHGTPTRPNDLYVVSVEGGETRALTDSAPAEEAARALVVPEKIVYPSTDGFEIAAYLYRPPEGASAPGGGEEPGARFPALLWIHGGPTSQFHDTFQQHVQFFVQRGYVVLMPNIRGSSGYGRAFEDANNGCWGRCDLEDVLAGVNYLRERPYVDGFNIGVTGTSYGGIMSMAAPTFAPDVFQASAAIAGYADYPHFMEEQELRHIKLLEYELGPYDQNRDLYRELSPIHRVADITTPFMVIHGEGFFPASEASLNFVRELERHYKPVTYKTYPNENYYIYRRDNRRQMLLDMRAFFDQHLGGHRIVPPSERP